MSVFPWDDLLQCWNRDVLPLLQADDREAFAAITWLGQPAATEEAIRAVETRLNTTFPPSYRSFLLMTNGWRIWDPTNNIYCIDEVRWYAQDHQDIIDAWNDPDERWDVPDEDYFVYGSAQRPTDLRVEYLPQTLYIGESVGGQFLLNPNIVTDDGEWETWYFSGGLPGAVRYRSFWDFMQKEYEMVLEIFSDLSA